MGSAEDAMLGQIDSRHDRQNYGRQGDYKTDRQSKQERAKFTDRHAEGSREDPRACCVKLHWAQSREFRIRNAADL